jgi:hypothetical protein
MPIFSLHAIAVLRLVVNDNLKICQTYQPSSSTSIPLGWRYYEFDKNYLGIGTHKVGCEKIGYQYIEGILFGKELPSERNIRIIFNSILVAGLIASGVLYYKTRRKKIIIALIVFIIIYLMAYGIWSFRIE